MSSRKAENELDVGELYAVKSREIRFGFWELRQGGFKGGGRLQKLSSKAVVASAAVLPLDDRRQSQLAIVRAPTSL